MLQWFNNVLRVTLKGLQLTKDLFILVVASYLTPFPQSNNNKVLKFFRQTQTDELNLFSHDQY